MQEPLEGGDVVVPLRGNLHGYDDSPVENPQQNQGEYACNNTLSLASHTIQNTYEVSLLSNFKNQIS